MLKFTYTDTSVQLERLTTSSEAMAAQRVTLAMRVGQSICIEPSQASFLLPSHLSGLVQLEVAAREEQGRSSISMCIADADFVEVSLRGTWIADSAATSEGIFLATLSTEGEALICELWQISQRDASCLRD
ncbi:MAG: alr0857 family protein [Geitlerinemataceae cyanobacterium]